MLGGPQIDVYSVENGKEGEPPGNSIDDDALAMREELSCKDIYILGWGVASMSLQWGNIDA